MLTATVDHEQVLAEFATVDAMEQELVRLEGLVSRVRARQLEILEAIDHLQVPLWDGTRSLKEWIAGRLDIQPRNAGDLATLARTESGPIRDALAAECGRATGPRLWLALPTAGWMTPRCSEPTGSR